MIKVNKNVFATNLSLTQQYCSMQEDKEESDRAKIFRSFNPMLNGKPIFSFAAKHFNFDIKPNLNYCTLTTWSVDPLGPGNEHVVSTLFEEQIKFKQTHNFFYKAPNYEGKILVSLIDCSVIDGASEVESLGLIDIYDIPPIDTWFYLTRNEESRLLFAWIPKGFERLLNEAISVNFLDIINWFEDVYPQDYKELATE